MPVISGQTGILGRKKFISVDYRYKNYTIYREERSIGKAGRICRKVV